VLDVAVDLVEDHGLNVGLGHLGFEDVIARAEVSRTTAYRIWPRKELFLEDLLRRLAATKSPCWGGTLDDQLAAKAQEVIVRRAGELGTEKGRLAVLVEVCRVAGDFYFTKVASSPSWLTYLALIATMRSLGDEALTAELRGLIEQTEADAVENASAHYEAIMGVLGFRVRPVPDGAVTLTHVGAVALNGMLLLAETRRDVSASSMGLCDPFRTGDEAEWSVPALVYANAIVGMLEPDPDHVPAAVQPPA
jgi:AcrR family transcriptional regulator